MAGYSFDNKNSMSSQLNTQTTSTVTGGGIVYQQAPVGIPVNTILIVAAVAVVGWLILRRA